MMDTIPRNLEELRIAMMEDMARQVVAQVEAEVRNEYLSETIAAQISETLSPQSGSRVDLTEDFEE